MSSYIPTKQHLRECLLLFFNLKKNATEAHRLLSEAYPEYAPEVRVCQKWFAQFKSGAFDVKDKERPGQPKKFVDKELKALLDEDPYQTQEELAKLLSVDRSTISKRLKAAGFIQKQGNWLPYELKPSDIERRLTVSEMLLQRYKKKDFLHRIVTGGEMWFYFNSLKRKKSNVDPVQSGTKVMLCIWWDEKGVLFYELLKPGETMTGERYLQQLIKLEKKLNEKRPEYKTGNEAVVFHHDNTRLPVTVPVKNFLENSGWEILPHPSYSPDLAPSDYHLFRLLKEQEYSGIHFTSVVGVKNWINIFLGARKPQFFWDGIHNLPERWAKVVASDGQYFE